MIDEGVMDKRRRGRPLGFKLSEESRRAISESKKGQRHTQETKDKISRTLMLYFRRLNPLSDEIINRYCRTDDDTTCAWVNGISDDLDDLDDIHTDRQMRNIRKTEIAYGNNIEYFFHEITPERILLIKEACKEKGVAFEEIFNSLLERL